MAFGRDKQPLDNNQEVATMEPNNAFENIAPIINENQENIVPFENATPTQELSNFEQIPLEEQPQTKKSKWRFFGGGNNETTEQTDKNPEEARVNIANSNELDESWIDNVDLDKNKKKKEKKFRSRNESEPFVEKHRPPENADVVDNVRRRGIWSFNNKNENHDNYLNESSIDPNLPPPPIPNGPSSPRRRVHNNVEQEEDIGTKRFKLHFLFDFSCLFKSRVLLSFAIIFALVGFIFPLSMYFTSNNIASFSWVYALVDTCFLMLILFFSVFILFIENRYNSVDTYFVGKGYKKITVFLIKTLAILVYTWIISVIQTLVLIISIFVFKQSSAMLQMFTMNFFGTFLFTLFITPIITCFSMFGSKIIYAISSLVIVLFTFTSLVPRFFPINNDVFTYNGWNQTNFVKTYDPIKKKEVIYQVSDFQSNETGNGKIQNEKEQRSPVYTPFMPGEILMSPFLFTYQIGLEPNLDGINNIPFQTNINRLNFIVDKKDGSKVDANGMIFMRSLDTNIFVQPLNDLRHDLIASFSNLYRQYEERFWSDDSKWDNDQFRMNVLSNFIINNPSAYYMLQFYYVANPFLANEPNNPSFIEYKHKFDDIIRSIESNTSPSFGAFLRYSVARAGDEVMVNGVYKRQDQNTVLGTLARGSIFGQIQEVYPFNLNQGRINYYSPINSEDYLNFINNTFIIDATFDEESKDEREPKLIKLKKVNQVGTDVPPPTTPSPFFDQNLLPQPEVDLYEVIMNSPLVGVGENLDQKSAFSRFIQKYTSNGYPNISDVKKWTSVEFKMWNEFVATRYDWFQMYIDSFKRVAEKTVRFDQYDDTYLRYFALNSNHKTPSEVQPQTFASEYPDIPDTNQNFVYLYSGHIQYTPFSENILFGSIGLLVIFAICTSSLLFIHRHKR